MSGWVNTDERKPDDEQNVLGAWIGAGYTPGNCAETLTYHASDSPVDGFERWVNAWGEEVDAPSHWQPWDPPKVA